MLYIREYPTQSRLKELFDYVDGHLVWRIRPRSDFKTSQGYGAFKSQCVGKIACAGKISGYWVTKINKSNYRTHRLIWIWLNGDLGRDDEIDHEDGDKSNYSISNLRLAGRLENTSNRGAQSNSKSGIKGVSFDKSRGKWVGQVKSANLRKTKRFDSIEAATEFARSTREKIHGEFHNHG